MTAIDTVITPACYEHFNSFLDRCQSFSAALLAVTASPTNNIRPLFVPYPSLLLLTKSHIHCKKFPGYLTDYFTFPSLYNTVSDSPEQLA
jgi:hypothetical protein